MDIIKFQNQAFKLREIEFPEFGNILISTNSLNRILLNEDGSYSSTEAALIDEKIFYFVEDSEINLSEVDLIKAITLELI